jgi:hypothetical protein
VAVHRGGFELEVRFDGRLQALDDAVGYDLAQFWSNNEPILAALAGVIDDGCRFAAVIHEKAGIRCADLSSYRRR